MKRDRFLHELKELAGHRGLDFEVQVDRGKGSHYRVRVGERMSTVKSGDLTPTYMKLVKKQLGLDRFDA